MPLIYRSVKGSELTSDEVDGNFQFLFETKQDTLTFDSVPTLGSSNPVTSDGIYTAISSSFTEGNGIDITAGIISLDINFYSTPDNIVLQALGGTMSLYGATIDISSDDGQIVLSPAYSGISSGSNELRLAGQLGGTFLDGTGVNGGLKYFADYSSSYTTRSLVDKNYVDTSFVSSTSNLTKVNNMEVSTGLYAWVAPGIVAASGTTFNVGSAQGYIVDPTTPLSTTASHVNYVGGTGLTTPFLLTHPATYLLINSSSTLVMQSSEPTLTQRRSNILLGVIGHPTGTITGVGPAPDLGIGTMHQVRSMFKPIKFINDGVFCYANSTDLTLANTAGTLFGLGIGFIPTGADGSASLSINPGAPTTFQYRTQTGVTSANTTVIDPLNYDLAGTDTAIPGSTNQATNQRIYLIANGNIRIQKGQTIYATLTDAIAAASNESFVVFANNRLLGVLIGILSVTKGCINLANTTTAKFLPVSKFGETVGSAAGIAIGTLQTAYNNSIIPQISPTDALGALTIKNARALNTSNVFDIQNIAGTSTFSVDGNGLTKISSLQLFDTTYKNTLVLSAPTIVSFGDAFTTVRMTNAAGNRLNWTATTLSFLDIGGAVFGLTLNAGIITLPSSRIILTAGLSGSGTALMYSVTSLMALTTAANGACYSATPGINATTTGYLALFNADPASYVAHAGELTGYRSNVLAGTNRYNINAMGTAQNIIVGKTTIGSTAIPTALLMLAAGTTAANTAPLKYTSGPLLTSPESGASEFLTDDYYVTGTTGNIRKVLRDYAYLAVTANLTLDGRHELIDCTTNTFTITLPTAIGYNKQYTIYNSGTGVITINTTSSQTISGAASGSLSLVQHDSLIIRSNGANWYKIN